MLGNKCLVTLQRIALAPHKVIDACYWFLMKLSITFIGYHGHHYRILQKSSKGIHYTTHTA
jgi:hypothetical protein